MKNNMKEIKVELGSGRYPKDGYITVDLYKEVNPDYVLDLEKDKLPFNNNSVDELFSSQVFEHLKSHDNVMKESHRVLKKDGKLIIEVPYWSSEGAFRDPTHVRFFSEKSFGYWDPDCEVAYYNMVAPFKVLKVEFILHPSPVIKILKFLFGIRFLKAFTNFITMLRFTLKPIK